VIRIEIPRVAPSLNSQIGQHWRHRKRTADLWQNEVYYALHQAGLTPAEPFPKARVAIRREGKRELDQDNLTGSAKPILDALRYAHVLVDDSPAHVELVVTQLARSKGPVRTVIEVTALEN